MLRDITIGQHFPGNSLVHRFDPRLKLVLTILYIVLLFAASNPLGLALSLVFLAVMYAVAKIPFRLILKSLKPIFPIIVFTAVLNLFFVSGEGDPVFKLGFLTVYAEGIRYAVLMAVRVMALIAGTSLLTYTTSPIVLTDAIEQLLKPLGRLHFPVHELAMMMSIALRFIPTLIEETDKIMNAQKARGAQLDNGKMTERIKALVPVLVPLFISAFRRADELAMAMECRCYRGGDGRTRLKVLRCEKQDYIDLAVCIACFAVILASRWVFQNFKKSLKPLPLGEVASLAMTERASQERKCRYAAIDRSLWQSDVIAGLMYLCQHPCPLRRFAPALPKGEPL